MSISKHRFFQFQLKHYRFEEEFAEDLKFAFELISKGGEISTSSKELEKLASKYGFIDKSGKVVIEPQFDEAGEFSEGLALVEKDDKYGGDG